MNSDSFFRYIEDNRDCDQSRLDTAVNKGLTRAKNDRVYGKKLLLLAAACALSIIMCITVNLRPFTNAVEVYRQNWHRAMPGTAEILDNYIKDMTGILEKYLGGE